MKIVSLIQTYPHARMIGMESVNDIQDASYKEFTGKLDDNRDVLVVWNDFKNYLPSISIYIGSSKFLQTNWKSPGSIHKNLTIRDISNSLIDQKIRRIERKLRNSRLKA